MPGTLKDVKNIPPDIWRQLMERSLRGDDDFPLVRRLSGGISRGRRVNMCWHNGVKIIRLISGAVQFGSIAKEDRIQAPALIIIPPQTLHTMYLPPYCYEESVVFDLKLLENFNDVGGVVLELITALQKIRGMPVILTWDDCEQFDILEGYLANTALLDTSCHAPEKALITAGIYSFFLHLYITGRLLSDKAYHESKIFKKHDHMLRVLGFVRDNYTQQEELLDKAAKFSGHNRNYFCRLFKAATSLTLTDYVNDYRLSKVVCDLITLDDPIAVIACRHGLENQSNFYRMFHEKYGMTPKKYRQHCREQLLIGQGNFLTQP